MRFFLFAATLALSAAAQAQTIQTEHIQAPGQPATAPYTDTASGAVFPIEVEGFKRFRITRPIGLPSISAAYVHSYPRAKISVIVFVEKPGGSGLALCSAMLEGDQIVLRKKQPEAILSDNISGPLLPGYSGSAFAALYSEPGGRGAVETYYYCAPTSPFRVIFRFQHATGFRPMAMEAGFIRAFTVNLPKTP